MDRSEVLRYFVLEYFDDDPDLVAEVTGYSSRQVKDWLNGTRQPQRNTLEFIMHRALAPEFRVVVEFAHFSSDKEIRPQLRKALADHKDRSGIYAFYDSMANLLYVGKATVCW